MTWKGDKPDYDVSYPQRNEKTGKTFWHRVGAAWDRKKGITVYLSAIPVGNWDGKLYLFLTKERADAQEEARKEAQNRLQACGYSYATGEPIHHLEDHQGEDPGNDEEEEDCGDPEAPDPE